MSLSLYVERAGRAVALASGDHPRLVYDGEYEPGDTIVLAQTESPSHVVIRLDEVLPPTLAYLRGPEFRYPVPFGDRRSCFSPRAFSGRPHLLSARYADAWETGSYRNLALNPHDIRILPGSAASVFPHASANVETRGEPAFAARNAIDGIVANAGHGAWPYTSWGINRDPGARLLVEFGRPVRLDRAAIWIRADFPHDAWWTSATLRFSDGSLVPVPLSKTSDGQTVEFRERSVEWAALDTLVKADDPSPFPALTQLELYGTEDEV